MQFNSIQIALAFADLLYMLEQRRETARRSQTDMIAGWIYLRFFQVRGDYIVRGDASEVILPAFSIICSQMHPVTPRSERA